MVSGLQERRVSVGGRFEGQSGQHSPLILLRIYGICVDGYLRKEIVKQAQQFRVPRREGL